MKKQVKRTPRRNGGAKRSVPNANTPSPPAAQVHAINSNEFASLVQLAAETPMEYELFIWWINLGRTRTVKKLAELTLRQELVTDPTPEQVAARTSYYYNLSGRNEWQIRLSTFIAEQARQIAAISKEGYSQYVATMLDQAAQISGHMQQMIDDFQGRRFRTISNHVDPDDENRTIQVVHEKVNVSDLTRLVLAFGRFNKDLRVALGLPSVLEIQGAAGSAVVKGYISISPDDWDDDTPAQLEAGSQTDE